MSAARLAAMSFADLRAAYVAKAERKGRTAAEVDEILRWATGWTARQLARLSTSGATFGTFIDDAPRRNPDRDLVTGVVCGVRVEEVADPFMREVRIIDKLVDELAKGRPMERILRSRPAA